MTATTATVVHRALSSPVRARPMEVLRTADGPMSTQELATAVDLHPNTVRSHLGILASAQLVSSSRRATGGRGRPRHLFAAVAEGDALAGVNGGYDLLASVLADRVALDHPDADRIVEGAAAAWAREHATSEVGLRPGAVIDQVLEVLGDLGFDADTATARDGVCLVADSCPIRALARSHPAVACSFHQGLVRGLLEVLGGGYEVAELDTDVDRGRCRMTLRMVA